MRDALKNYLTLASGLTEVGRQRAIAASKALVAQGEATAEQVTALADDLVQTSKNNREMIATLVRTEVERAMNAVGVATADSVEFLTKRLQTLESALREAAEQNAAAGGGAGAGDAGDAGDVTSTHEMAAPARAVAAKTAKPATSKPAAKAADKPAKGGASKPAKSATKDADAGGGSPAKPAKSAAKAAKAPAKKAAKKAQS